MWSYASNYCFCINVPYNVDCFPGIHVSVHTNKLPYPLAQGYCASRDATLVYLHTDRKREILEFTIDDLQ